VLAAWQAVLVRNTEAKERLPFELRNGLVLTVEESKGLEFDDIAIFDFFSDSPCTKEWHTLYGELPEESAAALGCERRSEFNPLLDGLLVEELKALYVALTRARKRCFIFDASEEKRKPMFDYLGALGVAEQGLDQQLSASTSKAGRCPSWAPMPP
jgi:superfamily I DNA/RNA helicase